MILKTEDEQKSRDLSNVNAFKTMFDRYYCIRSTIHLIMSKLYEKYAQYFVTVDIKIRDPEPINK